MAFALACGDVMPGCGARFEADTKEGLMEQVGPHARDVHDITELTPEVLEAVDSKIEQR